MARRKKAESYLIETTVLRVLGNGNSVLLDNNDVFGPIEIAESAEGSNEDIFAGVAAFAAGSKTELPAQKAFSRIAAGVKSTYRGLSTDLKEARRQSRTFFMLMCVFLSIGLGFIFVALGLLVSGRVEAGVIGTIASTLSQMATVVLFKKDQELRHSIDSYNTHVLSYQRVLSMVDVAETISDPQARDTSKQEIVRSLLSSFSPGDGPNRNQVGD